MSACRVCGQPAQNGPFGAGFYCHSQATGRAYDEHDGRDAMSGTINVETGEWENLDPPYTVDDAKLRKLPEPSPSGERPAGITDAPKATIRFSGDPPDQPPRYPEHEKMAALGDRKDEIQAFLDWLDTQRGEKGDEDDQGVWELAYYDVYLHDGLQPVRLNKEQIMARYFQIDLDTISAEKTQMLKDIRVAQGMNPDGTWPK